jgi:glucose/mannose transport system substrate-binding protein
VRGAASLGSVRLLGALVLSLGAAACDSAAPTPNAVEIIDWWVNAGELPALRALIAMFEQQSPDEYVVNTMISSSTDARKRIVERMAAQRPPETFQANGGWDLLSWVLQNDVDDKASVMAALNDTADWAAQVPRPVLDTVSVDGNIYAVPLNIHRVNTLFFNRKVFIDHGIPVPTRGSLPTLDDLFALAERLRSQGLSAPIALGTREPWTLSLLLFENVLVARAGGAGYRQFFAGAEDVLTSPVVATAVADLATLLAYCNPDAGGLTWDQAIDMVRRGDAAMTVMGDWAKGYFLDQARKDDRDVDFGQIPTPGTDGTFVFTTDTFGMPVGARNRTGALALLSLFGSQKGQDTFSLIKGSIPARQDAGMSLNDAASVQTMADFRAVSDDPSRLVPATAILAPPDYMNAINDVLSDYAGATSHIGNVRGNASVVLHALENRRDMLRNSPWH